MINRELPGKDCIKGVAIGRSPLCKIRIKDDSLSKFHATLSYSAINGWILSDGDNANSKSTNGTWILAHEDYEIYDQMIFKTGSYLLYANLTKNNVL